MRPIEVLWEGLEDVAVTESVMDWIHHELRPCLACVELEARAKTRITVSGRKPRLATPFPDPKPIRIEK